MKLLKQTATILGLLFTAGVIFNKAIADTSENLHIRTIASSCFACHGTLGNPAESDFSIKHKTLAGMPVEKFEEKMVAFRDGTAESTVMHHHAESLELAEIKGLAEYFAAQPVKKNILPPQQKLEPSHD